MNSPIIMPGEPQVIAKEVNLTIEQAVPMLFNAVQQIGAGMQNFHDRITAIERIMELQAEAHIENPST